MCKIDRLSRSLCDFTDLSKLFERHGVSFVSVRQNIATVIQTAYDLGGREMHLRRDAPAAKRSGWVSEANCEAAARPRARDFAKQSRKRVRGLEQDRVAGRGGKARPLAGISPEGA